MIRILITALACAALLALARAGLLAVQDPYVDAGWYWLALRSFAVDVFRSGAIAFPACVVARRSVAPVLRPGRALGRCLAALAFGALAWAFLTGRAPRLEAYALPFNSRAAQLAHAASLAVAFLVAVTLVARVRASADWYRSVAALAVLAFGSTAVAWIATRGTPASYPERPNVILISLDTTHPEHLGIYGYDRPTSPSIDRFASQAVRFEAAFTPFPWTLTAHGTMLTSLTPTAHGLRRDTGLSTNVPTLASELRRAGYRTAAMVDEVQWLSPRYGMAMGFDSYRWFPHLASERNTYLWPLLEDLAGDPFFLFLHYYDAHSDTVELPYESDAADRQALANDYTGPFTGCSEELDCCATRLLLALNERGEQLGPEEIAYIRDLYDAGLRTLDRAMGELFDFLESEGLLENTVVMITSDHGEAFFEHGKALHTDMWEESVRIPLIVRAPGMQSARSIDAESALVSLVDVAPTLLDYAGALASTNATMQGRSLRPLIESEGTGEPRDYVFIDSGQRRYAVRTRFWKLMQEPDGTQHLYNLAVDPAETNDLLASGVEPDVLADLRAKLTAEVEQALATHERLRATRRDAKLDAADNSQLRDLGYAGDD